MFDTTLPSASVTATFALNTPLLPTPLLVHVNRHGLLSAPFVQLTFVQASLAALPAPTSIVLDVPLIVPSEAVTVRPVSAFTRVTVNCPTPLVNATEPLGSVGAVPFGALPAVLVNVIE